ncbi:unnamed protein product, partial [Tetraodon nigroviridis]
RSPMNAFPSLSFPQSRAALWDGGPVGEKICLQLFSNRNPRLVLLEKALRLAQRHVRQSDKPQLQCFFLGSVLVDSDEAGATVTLDRFDPGRDQPGLSGRVPCTVLPGDAVVPCLLVTHGDTSDAVVQSESELHHCFKSLQQMLNSRQTLDLCQLVMVKGRIVCSQQSDATVFGLSWSSVCPSVGLDLQAVPAVPIIPTALLRSLTSAARPLPPPTGCQKGYLTMDQTRKLLLLLESDPKACSLPLVGLWLSGVTHVSSPQVWVSCLHFLFSSALLDRVFSDEGHFLLVLFCSTHKSPQFYKCGSSGLGPEPRLDYKLLTAFQRVTLYQVGAAEGQKLLCELSSEGGSRQRDVFRTAQLSFSRSRDSSLLSDQSSGCPAAAMCASEQDSGVEDEDLSPRPSPSPHLPAQQVSFLMDAGLVFSVASFADGSRTVALLVNHPGDAPYPCTSGPALPSPPPWIMLPPYVNRCWDQTGAVDTYQLLLQQDQQLRLLQSQEHSQRCRGNRCVCGAAISHSGASLFWAEADQPVSAPEAPGCSSETPPLPSSPTCSHRSPPDADLSAIRPVAGAEDADVGGEEARPPPFEHLSSVQSPVLGESVSMCSPSDGNQNFYQDLMVKPPPSRKQQACGDHVISATLQELRRLGVNVDEENLSESDRKLQQTVESSRCALASINPAAVVSRLSLSESSFSSLLPCGSVDLSLEANAIALRYLSHSQLSRLSAGALRGHAPSNSSLLSPSNMSVATRKYMRKYGLIEEEEDEDEAEVAERSPRQRLTEAQGAEILPQSQLIRDLQPKMQLLTAGPEQRPPPGRAEASVGNILDLSRLRQLPKLF